MITTIKRIFGLNFESKVNKILKGEKQKYIRFGNNFFVATNGMTILDFKKQLKEMISEKYWLGAYFDVKEIGTLFGVLEESLAIEHHMRFLQRHIKTETYVESLRANIQLFTNQHIELQKMKGRLSNKIEELPIFIPKQLTIKEREYAINFIFEFQEYTFSNHKYGKQKPLNWKRYSLDELCHKSDIELAKLFCESRPHYASSNPDETTTFQEIQ